MTTEARSDFSQAPSDCTITCGPGASRLGSSSGKVAVRPRVSCWDCGNQLPQGIMTANSVDFAFSPGKARIRSVPNAKGMLSKL